MIKISTIVLSYNSENTIKETLNSLKVFDEVIVLDSGSKDNTKKIAKSFRNVKWFERKFDNFSNQRNFATSKAENDWVLHIDSDEVISKDLLKYLEGLNENSLSDSCCYNLRFYELMWGKICKYGIWGKWHIRLYNRKMFLWTGKIHEKISPKINKFSIKNIKYPIVHNSHKNIKITLHKFDVYTDVQSEESYNQYKNIPIIIILFIMFYKSTYHILSKYIINLGFLEGYRGVLMSILRGYYEIILYSKIVIKRLCTN